jgi:glycosyltransferase involved in cell wall biosynthesis/SAM-dependent methyltransferase
MAVFREHALAHQLLDGLRGLEIGAAAHNPFGLNTRNVAPIDDHEHYALHQAGQMGVAPATVDIWAFADAIPVPDNSEDFIISSHVVEHLPNVVAAFREWNRVVRVGGYIFMIVPQRDALAEDVGRPITGLEHFIDDYRAGVSLDTHATEDVPGGRMGHYHVFTPDLIVALVAWMKEERLCDWELTAREDVDSKVGNGFTLAFRVVAKFPADNVKQLNGRAHATAVASSAFTVSPEIAAVLGKTAARQQKTVTVGLFGTFEVDNYGDKLLPILFEQEMQRRIPGLRARLFSPGSGIYSVDGRPIHTVAELGSHHDDLAGYAIGGGDIVRFDPAHAAPSARPAAHADLFILPSALGGLNGFPVVWNAPGVPHVFAPDQQEVIAGVAALATYVAVRDEESRNHLGPAAASACIAPDLGFALADAFPLPLLDGVFEAVRERCKLPEQYIAAHLSPATAREEDWTIAAEALAELGAEHGLPILLLPLGPVHGDAKRVRTLRKADPDRFSMPDEPLHPLEFAALIGHAEAFFGTGLHGNITAFVYGVPSVAVNSRRLSKLNHFGVLTGRPVLESWREVRRDWPARNPEAESRRRTAIRRQIDAHLTRMAEALSTRAAAKRDDRAWLQLLRGLSAGRRFKPTSAATLQSLAEWRQREQRYEDQVRQLERRADQLAAAEIRARESDRAADDLRRLFEVERNHLGWWMLQSARVLRDRLFPRGGWRWRAYLAARAPLRWLLHPRTRTGIARFLGRWNFIRKRPGPGRQERRRMRERIDRFRSRPLISVLAPVYNVDAAWLRAMVASVRRQVYPYWELCLVNDGSTAPHIRALLDGFAARDSRIRVKHLPKNEGISGASNHCLAMATGEFSALLDHDDELTADAFYEIAAAADADPALDVCYSDEDKISAGGACYDPTLKPDWNPGLLLTCNYVSHLTAYRTELVRAVGGFRSEFDGSQDYDLLLRATERTRNIAHIPKVLYHWRVIETSTAGSASAKPYAYAAARRALEEAMRRRGSPAEVETRSPGQYRIHAPIPAGATASLIVYQPERTPAVDRAMRDLLPLARQAIEVIVVSADGLSSDADDGTGRLRLLRCNAGEPASKSLNAAAALARGDFLAFLDAGMRPLDGDWLAALLEPMRSAGVAAVGGRVLASNGRLMHSGYVVEPGQTPASSHTFFPTSSINRLFYAEATRNCSAVGGGCFVVRRSAFISAAGFDEGYCRNWHDVDLCLRLRERSGEIIYSPWAVVQQTVAEQQPVYLPDQRLFADRWRERLPRRDPFLHHGVPRRRAA